MRGVTQNTETDHIFHVHSVSKVYPMGDVDVPALRSVDLDLLEGEFVAGITTFCDATHRIHQAQEFK